MNTRTPFVVASVMLVALTMGHVDAARAAPCFASDADGTCDQDGLANGVVTVTAASTSAVPPVDVVLTLGARCDCLHFGGEATFKPDKKWLAKGAPTAPGCPPAP